MPATSTCITDNMSLTSVEQIKQQDPTLAGRITVELADAASDRFDEADTQYLKFHGIYQQFDRDMRKRAQEKTFFMVRVRIPAGALTAQQYIVLDTLATHYGNGTLRITTRQDLQFHGVTKSNLRAVVAGINAVGLSTLGTCGDVNRAVVAPPGPTGDRLVVQVREHAIQVGRALMLSTVAYQDIWVRGVQPEPNRDFTDPLYGRGYLPRKFKIGFAIPPVNDVDIFSQCCGFIAIVSGTGQLRGYNVVVGGGMGRSHGNPATFPRLGDIVGFVPTEKVVEVARAILMIHRDFGDRTNRRHARLKYVLAERGVEWLRAELQRRAGFTLGEPEPFKFDQQGDRFGWGEQADGRFFYWLFVETGRITGELKGVLRHIIEKFGLDVRLTPACNLILCNINPADRPVIEHLLSRWTQISPLRLASGACVALPTCTQALAEAERFLPRLISQLEKVVQNLALANEQITIRISGCPNGCSRPYTAEIGLVGRTPGHYQIWLGGNVANTRLNKLWRDKVAETELPNVLGELLKRFRTERFAGERFGDWAVRALQFL